MKRPIYVAPSSADVERRPCTCHPDDNPPVPCPRMYALQDCRRAAALAAEIESLRARLAEAERDAVRYRWLRDRAWPFEFNGDTPADADAAIDAAMRPPAKNHTPRCSYWDGLFAQVCNCGAADNERA